MLENFQNMCLRLDAEFLIAPGLAWQVALKKTKVKLDLLTDINRYAIHRYAKANKKIHERL